MTETGPHQPAVPPPGDAGPRVISPISPWPERARLAWASMRASTPLSKPAAIVAGLMAAAAMIAVVATLWAGRSTPPPELVLPRAVRSVPGAVPGATATGDSTPGISPGSSTTTAPGGLAVVHAAGAVAHPGIYVVPAGGRVADVVTAAGGAVAEADLDRLNLAARVVDGDRVYVPRRGEVVEPAALGSSGSPSTPAAGGPRPPSPEAPLDLNTVDAQQLDALPGVGPATSRAIVGYRERNGRFRSVDELIDVPGIGPSKLETIRPLVRV